jgi:ankyrin repeat protein
MKLNTVFSILLLSAAVQNTYSMQCAILSRLSDYIIKQLITAENGRKPFHLAVIHNSKNVFDFCVSRAEDINAKDRDGMTPLHYLMKTGSLDMLEALVQNGADVNAKNMQGNTPLYYATHRDYLEMAKALIHKGCDVNVQNIQGLTSLECAVELSRESMVRLLLNNDANANILNSAGFTAKDRARRENKLILLALFNEYDDLKQGNGIKPMQETWSKALQLGHISTIKQLISKGFKPKKVDLKVAINRGREKIVLLLLQNGLAPAQEHLKLAKRHGYKHIGSMLKSYFTISGPNSLISKSGISKVAHVELPQDIVNLIAAQAI